MTIDNWENEGGMIPSTEKPMLPYVPPWACRRWGDYEHDWLDCVECNKNYEKYVEQHEQPPCCDKEDRNMNGGCNNCGDPSF